MISAQHVVNIVLDEAAKLGRADETMVLVTDRVEATLRWAGNSMTTNGVSVSRRTTVISIVRKGDSASIGTVVSAEVDPRVIPSLVAVSQESARSAPQAGDAAPLLADTRVPADWEAPVPGTGAEVFADVAGSLSRGFRGTDRLYGFAQHSVATTFLASSTGLRRRYTQPSGTVEINGKRGGASAWAAIGTPDFVDVPTDLLLEQLSTRLGWAQRSVELPAGRYETIMPPSPVADMMVYLAWSMAGRGAEEGRTALSAPGGGTRVGERLTELPLTLFSDPMGPGLHAVRRDQELLGDGVGVRQRYGDQPGGLDPRRGDQRTGLSAGYRRQIRRQGRGCRRQPGHDRGVGESRRDDRGHRARPAADHAVVHPRGRPHHAATDRVDPRRGLPRRKRRGDRGGQQLPVQREPARPAATGYPGRCQREDPAAGMGRLGHPGSDAVAADTGLPHVIGEPGAVADCPGAMRCSV